MEKNSFDWEVALAYVYNLVILGVTVWLIGWHDWSPWTGLLSLLLLSNPYESCDCVMDDDDSDGSDTDSKKS